MKDYQKKNIFECNVYKNNYIVKNIFKNEGTFSKFIIQ